MAVIFVVLCVAVAQTVTCLNETTTTTPPPDIVELNTRFTSQLDHIILVASFDRPTHAVFVLEFRLIPTLEQRLNATVHQIIASNAAPGAGLRKVRAILGDIERSVQRSLPNAMRPLKRLLRWFYTRLITYLQPQRDGNTGATISSAAVA